MLESVRLPDSVVAPLIHELSHAEGGGVGSTSSRERRRFISYRDMSVQQLGSIYERLLEREPVRNEDGSIEVRPNSYARKDSGSFFTPQELVDLIVDRTLKPLAEERLAAFEKRSAELRSDSRPNTERWDELRRLDPAEAVLELKVLDPAMGSGHFLVSAVDFLSDYIADLVEYVPAVPEWLAGEYVSPLVGRVASIRRDIVRRARELDWIIDEAQLTDQAIIRRMVLKRCIYGVDKNPLTVELAKVSLWLHSFTVGAPLSFLDHHLRCGDSLVGMSVTEATGRAEPAGWAVRKLSDSRSRGGDVGDAAHRGDVGRRHRGGAGVGVAVQGRRGHDSGRQGSARLPVRAALDDGGHEEERAGCVRESAGGDAGESAGRRVRTAGAWGVVQE